MRSALLVLTAAAVLAGCSSSARAPGTTRPPHLSDAAAVFVAVLGGGPANGSVRTYVYDHTVCSQALRQPPCAPVPIPGGVQHEVGTVLGPEVIFTAQPPTRLSPGGPVVVTLGAPRIDGDRATVTVETNCGPLCGEGQIVVLARRGSG